MDIPSESLTINNNVTAVDLSQPIGETTLSLSQDILQMFNDDTKFATSKEKSSIQLTQEKQQNIY